MTIFERVKRLNLPIGEYVIVGGAMEAHGIRPAKDIDVVVTKNLFNTLLKQGWKKCLCDDCNDNTKKILKGDGVDIISEYSWKDKYTIKTEDLIKGADIINGIAFVSLYELMNWKKACAREKDLEDIKLIEEYLKKDSNLMTKYI